MYSLNDKISLRQLQILLILDVFGTGVTILPRKVAEYSAQDGWICVIIATVVMIFFTYIIITLAGKFPDSTFTEYTSKILSYPIGILISIGFVIKIVISVSLELRFFGEIVRQNLLENTPFTVICAFMLVLGAYGAARGYETRARLAQILIFIVMIPLLLVVAIALKETKFLNLKPMFTTDSIDILRGSYSALFAFSGVDFCLLVFPYLRQKNDMKAVRKSVIKAVAIIGILITFITAVSIARFGKYDIVHQMWPVLSMMDTISIPGSFIERQGALIMSFWIVSMFAIVSAGMFFSSLILRDTFKKGKHYMYILFLIPIIYLLTFVPKNIVQAYDYLRILNSTFGIAYFFFIPVLLLIVAKVRGVTK